MLRLNFDAPPTSGVTLRWQCPDAILQVAPVAKAPAHGPRRTLRQHGFQFGGTEAQVAAAGAHPCRHVAEHLRDDVGKAVADVGAAQT